MKRFLKPQASKDEGRKTSNAKGIKIPFSIKNILLKMHIILNYKHGLISHRFTLLLPILRQLAPQSRKTRQTQTRAFLRARRKNREIIPHSLKALGMNKTLFSAESSCPWCVGTVKAQRIPAATDCSELEKRLKVCDSAANTLWSKDLWEKTWFCGTSGATKPCNYCPWSYSLGCMGKTGLLH